MNLDITWTITAIIAVCSLISPIAVAIINNSHNARIKKIELEHDKQLRHIDLQQQALMRQTDIYYADKKEAFSEFAKCAGLFSMRRQNSNDYESLHSSIDKALLFCNADNQANLCRFQKYIDAQVFGTGYSPSERTEYSERLNELSLSLNRELESTKPVIDCECRKY